MSSKVSSQLAHDDIVGTFLDEETLATLASTTAAEISTFISLNIV
jgi:hypothetical protein